MADSPKKLQSLAQRSQHWLLGTRWCSLDKKSARYGVP